LSKVWWKTIVPLEVLEKAQVSDTTGNTCLLAVIEKTFAINIYLKKKARKPPPDDLQAKQN